MTGTLFDLVNPEPADAECGVAPSSPLVTGARQTGQTITTDGWSVADTSLEAYRHLQDSLPAREQAVLIGLRRYAIVHGHAPTSYELFEAMRADGAAFDLNSVRPRLNSLFNKGDVVRLAKRPCRVTNKTAYTWAIQEEKPHGT